MNTLHTWRIVCNHTPEIIDRILLPIRKRGLVINSLHYQANSDGLATCVVTFEEEAAVADQIFKNLHRTIDIVEMTQQ